MMKLPKENFPPLKMGFAAHVIISDVDGAHDCRRNVLTVVTHIEHDL